MITMKNTHNLLLLGCGLITGIALFSFFKSCKSSPGAANETTIEKPSAIRERAEKEKQVLQYRIDSFDKQTLSLVAELDQTRQQLAMAKVKAKQVWSTSARQVKQLTHDTLTTTSHLIDSMMTAIENTQNEKDSLYEATIANQDSQLRINDTTSQLQQLQYASLQRSFEQSLGQQETLLHNNQQLAKKLKRQQVKGKLLSALAMAATGFTASYLLRH